MNEDAEPPGVRSDTEEPLDSEERTAADIPVVGIGASAGGLEAFRLLLGALPTDTGLAIVLIQHLDPTHQSSLSEILGRAIGMPVIEAGDGMLVEPNHVYVIGPNTDLTIGHRVLRTSARSQSPRPHTPIDHFLESLAQDCGRRAIGVILSGAGSDGALGLQAVKEAGGATFAQDPATAEFSGMPRMAVAANCVDFVLAPAQIAVELARLAGHPTFAAAPTTKPGSPPHEEEAGLNLILQVMHETSGIDFSLYRQKTVRRRIMRRLALRNMANIGEYARRLRKDPGERNLLQRDLLISVTSFFRDPESFDALSTLVFPAIVQNRPPDAVIRIWVPGCATGEEAYSIAISLQEYLEKTGVIFPVQIFASDVSEPAIEKARRGIFLDTISSEVSQDRLDRYFTKVEEGYQVGKELRDLCVFSRHNLINDPPFGKLDLISCRNVLIYLGAVQKNVIPVLHYALKPNSFLMLGKAESASFESMFSIVDRDHKIYRKRELARRTFGLHTGAGVPRWGAGARMVSQAAMTEIPDLDSVKAVDRILLSKYSPAGVVVDEGLEVLEIRGDVTPFFKLPAGKASLHLLKLAPDTGLFLEIEKLVHQAAENGQTVSRVRVPYERDGTVCEVNIEATPLTGNRRAVFVLLDPASRAEAAVGKSPEKPVAYEEAIAGRDRQISKLREEVAEARRRILSVVEENQIWDEASQSAAEEALSANEELQSLNEELETAKEELQSTNEELITLNEELELKNVVITESRNEAQIALFHTQESLRQAETMEAIGRLAGGIAHDFNNLLTTMVGYTHLVGCSLSEDHEATEYVREIQNAAQKAASLTDQLLAFGRQKVLQPKVFDLNAVVADFARMLARVLGERIKVVIRAGSDLRCVRADPGEIGRALMNLCLNARDAMPAGGTLTIQTANITIGEAQGGLHHLAAGPYVELSVIDTGVGMAPDVKAHLFEPFFSTKETGKGTGLGLPTVLGIVLQSGGAIWCESEPGHGTTFQILLPAVAAVPAASDAPPTGGLTETPKGWAEVVLLVEDEDHVRKLTNRILQSLGYVVLEAPGGPEGLAVCEGHQGKIDLLLSDVVMPNLGGRELAERISTIRPDIKVLFMSGHTEDVLLKEGVKAGRPFLQKPFAPSDLARKVREVLDWPGRNRGPEKS